MKLTICQLLSFVETGFVESPSLKSSGKSDDHFDRISQVREAIRKKRCEERGQDYLPPDNVRKGCVEPHVIAHLF